MRALLATAQALAGAGDANSVAVGAYIEKHQVRIGGWLWDSMRRGRDAVQRDELRSVALLAVCEALKTDEPDLALSLVRNALQNHSRRSAKWARRHVELDPEACDAELLHHGNRRTGSRPTDGGAEAMS